MAITGWPFVFDLADVIGGVARRLELGGVHHQCDEELMGARHPAEVLAGSQGAAL